MSDSTCMVESAADAGGVLQPELERRRRKGVRWQERLEQMESLFAHVADAVFVAEPEGQIVDANPAACALLGYEKQELIGMHPW
jgi:PAS domain-containing protein